MIDYAPNFKQIKQTPLSPWLQTLPSKIEEGFNASRWGDLPRWIRALEQLPDLKSSLTDINNPRITVGKAEDCAEQERSNLENLLRAFHPWRKGPYQVFGIDIESEWRSDIKWDRLKDHIHPLGGRLVLDVGCGNGYHCWRMAGAGAKLAVGIDSTPLYALQFQAMQKFIRDPSVAVFPLGIDDMPEGINAFDSIFSMGLIYHRRSPLDHLLQLHSLLREGGELVLETLVIDGKPGEVLSPKGRYAKMPNVWFIPSVPTMGSWLKRMGFEGVKCIDVTRTTPTEQRATAWMGFQSLKDFLDPENHELTVEGYPAPQRAIFLATKG